MAQFNIVYSQILEHEVKIKAISKKDAIKKFRDVMGDTEIRLIWKVNYEFEKANV